MEKKKIKAETTTLEGRGVCSELDRRERLGGWNRPGEKAVGRANRHVSTTVSGDSVRIMKEQIAWTKKMVIGSQEVDEKGAEEMQRSRG